MTDVPIPKQRRDHGRPSSGPARPSPRGRFRVELTVVVLVIATFVVSMLLSRSIDAPSTTTARPDDQDGPSTIALASRAATHSAAIDTGSIAPTPSAWDDDFKAARARFDEARWFGDDPAALLLQARQANERLPVLLAQGRISASDALLLKADLLEVLEPDERRRVAAFDAWWSAHPWPRPSTIVAGVRYQDALARERSLVLEWQTQPSVDRDAHDLEEQLRRVWTTLR